MLLVSVGSQPFRYFWGRGRRTRSDQPKTSVIPEAPRARTTVSPSAVKHLSLDLDWDFAQSSRSRGLSLDADYGRTTSTTSARRHARLSRIPERLYGTLPR